MTKTCGVDEAGRGPVIGPLVMAGVSATKEEEQALKELGVKDSKMLTKEQRESMFDKIKEMAEYKIIVISPQEVDAAVEDPEVNLNRLEGYKSMEIINDLNPSAAIVDCPSTNVEAYTEFLKEQLKNKETKLIVEHKADEKYPVCSAASILAKVTRDRAIEKIKEEFGDCGSGYPSDPSTQKFLKEHWQRHPELFRKSWASYKRIVREKEQQTLGNY